MSTREQISDQPKGSPLTGRMVLLMLLAFFGVVIAVNIVMLGLASSTFSGIGDKNAYMAGITHNRSLATAREQERRAWRIDASVKRVAPGRSVISILREDGGAFVDLDVVVRFEHPASSRLDRRISLAPSGPQAWRGAVDLPVGIWDLVIEMRSGGTVVFLSRNRIEASDKQIEHEG